MSDLEVCRKCGKREGFTGSFYAARDGRYLCLMCYALSKQLEIERNQDQFRRQYAQEYKHGDVVTCPCGVSCRIDFGAESMCEVNFANSCFRTVEGKWVCVSCKKG